MPGVRRIMPLDAACMRFVEAISPIFIYKFVDSAHFMC